MNILILGAAGFIGTNLTIELAKDINNCLTLVDRSEEYFNNIKKMNLKNIQIKESALDSSTEFKDIIMGQDIVYHLVSTNIPTTSNKNVTHDIQANVEFSLNLF